MTKLQRTDLNADAASALIAALQAPPPAPPRNLTPDSLLTIPEAASELRICRSNFYKLMNEDRIRTLKLGSRTLIEYREILRFIGELRGET
ncbi:helix-turn-helix domain-containing protein [Mycobacteroides abscessus]|uniref:DNA-binding protein, excisionase family n=1 Tax=Mycobacteroides abscessus subsp. abscessus TaxID=1185650 RepID=A0AB38D2D4_9MYCO|nr:helix-turn-helix domain-containing protein [Mycobacteroides abscessus]MBE5419533.1 hypothetical protein [Mycobacteroides abscessus]MBE5455768.1 hypothetical protein [Mycobacteroides abscessus]MBN7463491.1 helix-turn-helix domain-containing protein [Mycobacteroides abscessus subsp. abscessus]MBN7555219.1 helix-turn-helix domain-containing protein [Mycobacteroides abscessus subsp. abscessus]MDM2404611.1 helix-turn-helix domain-containing protein [Mycobacteroides abscessus]